MTQRALTAKGTLQNCKSALEIPEWATAYDNDSDMGFKTGDSELDEHLETLRDYFDVEFAEFLENTLALKSYEKECLIDSDMVFYFDVEEAKEKATEILNQIEEIKVIQAERIIDSPPTMSGPLKSTFYYEEHKMYAIEDNGSYHQISEFDSIKEIEEESEHWLSYANEDENFFTNYAEDGDINADNFKRSVSDLMRAFFYFKNL